MAIYSNTLKTIREYTSQLVGDLVLGTLTAGSTTTLTMATLDAGYNRADDYFIGWEVYTYEGTNIGVAREVSDWVNSTHVLTVTPAASSAYATSSKVELHRKFMAKEYLNAINMAIEACAGIYLIDIIDNTTTTLIESTSNDGNTLHTYTYNLPTTLLYIHRITTEHTGTSAYKLTGTVSGTFTRGETVTGGTSGATGILSYSGSTYIRVREVSGTFVTGETATGGTSGKTCSSITKVESDEAGDGTFPDDRVIDPRFWHILKAYDPDLKLSEQLTITADLRLQYEGQGSQPIVTSDTDTIALPPDWITHKAVTLLPYSKIEEAGLLNTFKLAEAYLMKYPLPSTPIHSNSRAVIE